MTITDDGLRSMKISPKITPKWWREAAVYQVYPASFNDTNGDGIGDLAGVTEKLDYIQKLGVDVVWLSPINKSPLVDMGYDISDYKDIDPRYGTLETFDTLIAEMNKRGLKFVLDLVVNHTSDQHTWFKESRSSKTNPKADWYIWKDAKYDKDGNRQPPNNWCGFFTPSAWNWDETRQQYYLCLFADEQPDLNWENPDVRDAVCDVVTFWLERGVRGFRLDVINLISKDQAFPDADVDESVPGPYYWGDKYFANGPRLHEYLQQLGAIFKKYDAFTVGETPFVQDIEEITRTVGADRDELGMAFQFDIVQLDDGPLGRYSPGQFTPAKLKECIRKWQTELPSRGGWNALFIENHDQARAVSRYLSDAPQHRAHASMLIAMMLVFQSGTPFVYQGQELGLANVPKSWDLDKYIDIESQHAINELKRTNAPPEKFEELKVLLNTKSRDNARVPMQWDASENAGFTTGTPWMPLNDDYKEWNAAKQVDDPNSPYTFWSRALKLRKQYKDAVVYGDFEMFDVDHPDVIAFSRTSKDGTAIGVVLNFTEKNVTYKLPFAPKDILLNNFSALKADGTLAALQPFQGLVVSL